MHRFEENHEILRGKRNHFELHGKKKYTWQQVAERNSENEAWIIVHEKVYDVTGKIRITYLTENFLINWNHSNRVVE